MDKEVSKTKYEFDQMYAYCMYMHIRRGGTYDECGFKTFIDKDSLRIIYENKPDYVIYRDEDSFEPNKQRDILLRHAKQMFDDCVDQTLCPMQVSTIGMLLTRIESSSKTSKIDNEHKSRYHHRTDGDLIFVEHESKNNKISVLHVCKGDGGCGKHYYIIVMHEYANAFAADCYLDDVMPLCCDINIIEE